MEILVRALKATPQGIAIPNETGDIVVVCHSIEPWDHLRIYTQDQWKQAVHLLGDENVSIERIARLVGEPIGVFLPNHIINIEPVFLNLVSVDNKAAEDFVYIQDSSRMIQIWDERTAPTDISDRSTGRIRHMGPLN